MSQHLLQLDVPDTRNGCILKILDSSVYSTVSTPTCPDLQVQVPGFTRAVDIPNTQPGFIFNLTACDLALQTADCGTTYWDLPDGIYIIKYSVAPNQYVYVEYNHLRITKALNIINAILCDLDVAACDPPEKVKAKYKELDFIYWTLLAAKAKVETCHNPQAGMNLYNYAIKLLDKLNCCKTSC